jgi:hypothetical protein
MLFYKAKFTTKRKKEIVLKASYSFSSFRQSREKWVWTEQGQQIFSPQIANMPFLFLIPLSQIVRESQLRNFLHD